jgi:hypothetical protein
MLDPLPGARLYRVPGTLPRVYLTGRTEIVGHGEITDRLFAADVVTGALALVAPAPGVTPLLGPLEPASACEVQSFSNSRIQARCRAKTHALAVFLEQFDVGWTALVDGAPAPLLQTNLLMRGVPVAKGDHTIVLSYRPPGVRAGATISILCVSIIAICAMAALRGCRQAKARVQTS